MGLYALYAGLIIYACFSSPTPDALGWPEYCVALLILFAVGALRCLNKLVQNDYPAFLAYNRSFLIYMLTIPLMIGALNSYPLNDTLRDIIPLVFLILPLCFYRKKIPHFEVLLMLIGTAFALRYVLPTSYFFINIADGSLLYLANSPLLPFTAIMGFHYFLMPSTTYLIKRILGITSCILCLLAMGIMLQRAPFILSIMGCLFIFCLRATHRPLNTIISGTLIIICLVFISPFIFEIFNSLSSKTLTVGLNSRLSEWESVIMQTTLFGHGWGAIWQSPAVAHIWVRYTHNIISYYWLKAGIIGALLSIIFIYMWGRQIIVYVRYNPAMGIAILIPFIIHVTVYTGFKTLDFALLLTLVTQRCQQLRSQS